LVQQELEERLATHRVVLEATAQPLELPLMVEVVEAGTAEILVNLVVLVEVEDLPKEVARLVILAQE